MTGRCEMELCPNWAGDEGCPCAVLHLPRPVVPVTEVREVNTWFTLPKWTTAHEIEQIGSLGYIRIWLTACGREYRREDPEYDDSPIQAPDNMKRCGRCVRLADLRGGAHG